MAHLHAIDLLIILTYFVVILYVGFRFRGEQKNDEDYIVGGRSIHWLAVLGSIIATEVSAATFLATPGVGFSENMNYLQFGIGSIIARFCVASLFIGVFYSINCLSIYEYLRARFGATSHYTASLYFLLTRLMASGVRLMIAATGISVIMEQPFFLCLVVFTVISTLYTAVGGIRSVIHTDCIQGIIFIVAGVIAICFLVTKTGWDKIIEIGTTNEKFDIINFNLTSDAGTLDAILNNPNFFPIAVLSGFILTMASMGTDQDLTQRMLTCKNAKESKRSLITSGFIALPIAFVFLFIGIALYAYYQVNPDPTLPQKIVNGISVTDGDQVFSHFIKTALPLGLKGILIVGMLAAATSSVDSTIAALSSSAVVDLYKPLIKASPSGKEIVLVSRLLVIVFAVILIGLAWIIKDGGTFLWLSFKLSGVTYSSLLGVFLLGALTKRGSDVGNLVAMLSGSILVAGLLYLSENGIIRIGWTWLILFGLVWTFCIGAMTTNKDSNLSSQKI